MDRRRFVSIFRLQFVTSSLASRRCGLVVLLDCVCALGQGAIAYAGWFPKRPIYDYEKFDPDRGGDCTDMRNVAAEHGRCGPVDGPVFNSFINTPSYGDERSFLDGRLTDEIGAGAHRNVVHVGDGERDLTLRIYINNNANERFGAKTTASGTRVRVGLPRVSGEALRAVAYISADNASPAEVEDTIDLVAKRESRLEYVPGSARLRRDSKAYVLPSEIVTTGALVGDNDMNGVFSAGFNKAALVTLRVKIVPADEIGLAWWLLFMGFAAGSVAVAVLAYRRSRARVAAQGSVVWQKISADALATQIIGGLVVAGIGAIIALLIKASFS